MTAQMTITAREARTEPKYSTMAPALLKRCREFYQDPENERAYQEWKANRDAKTAKTVSA